MGRIKGCGFYFHIPVPSDAVLCSMKISALLSRQKGRDFYDVMFLLAQTAPDYAFLTARCGIRNLPELKSAVASVIKIVNLTCIPTCWNGIANCLAYSMDIMYICRI